MKLGVTQPLRLRSHPPSSPAPLPPATSPPSLPASWLLHLDHAGRAKRRARRRPCQREGHWPWPHAPGAGQASSNGPSVGRGRALAAAVALVQDVICGTCLCQISCIQPSFYL